MQRARAMREAGLLAAMLLLVACSKPQPPEKERPVEPQAALGQAMREPLQQAHQAAAHARASEAARRRALHAASH